MDFVQNCRLKSFPDGVHMESVGEGKVQYLLTPCAEVLLL